MMVVNGIRMEYDDAWVFCPLSGGNCAYFPKFMDEPIFKNAVCPFGDRDGDELECHAARACERFVSCTDAGSDVSLVVNGDMTAYPQ